MKKVTVFLEGGSKMTFKCKSITFDLRVGNRKISIVGLTSEVDFMIDKVIGITVKNTWF